MCTAKDLTLVLPAFGRPDLASELPLVPRVSNLLLNKQQTKGHSKRKVAKYILKQTKISKEDVHVFILSRSLKSNQYFQCSGCLNRYNLYLCSDISFSRMTKACLRERCVCVCVCVCVRGIPGRRGNRAKWGNSPAHIT